MLNRTLVLFLLFTTACTIYQSPERKTFESESPSFKIQSLQKISCSFASIKLQASQSRLITITDNHSMWEHVIDQKSNFESADFHQTEYCIYDYKK